MKHWKATTTICLIIFLGFLASRDSLARIFWQQYQNPKIALSLVSKDADLAMQLGNYYFGNGDYHLERAKQAYKKAVGAKSPPPLWAHYQLARIFFVEGNSDKAIGEINEELKAYPENLRSLYVRGLIYGYRNQIGDLKKAEDDFTRFTRWAPTEWAGYNDLAWILAKAGKYEESKGVVLRAFENAAGARENPWLWNALGAAQLNLGEYENAKESFLEAKKMTVNLRLEDWRRAYPGNNPTSAEAGFGQFRKALEKNLERAEALSKI